MTAYTLYIATLLAIFLFVFMGFRAAGIFRRAIEISPMYNKKLELKNKIENLKEQIKGSQRTISDLEEMIKSLEGDKAQAQMTIDKGKKWATWLDNYDDLLKSKKAVISGLNEQIKELTDKLNSLKDDYKKKIDESVAQINRLSDHYRDLQATVEGLKKDIEKLEKEKKAAIKETDAAKKLEAAAKRDQKIAEDNKTAAEDAAAIAENARKLAENKKAEAEQARDKAKEEQRKEEEKLNQLKIDNAKANELARQLKDDIDDLSRKKEQAKSAENAANTKRLEAIDAQSAAEINRDLAKQEEQQAIKDRDKALEEKTEAEKAREVAKTDAATAVAERNAAIDAKNDAIKAKNDAEGEKDKEQETINQLRAEIASLKGELDPLRVDNTVIEERKKRCWEDLYSGIPDIIKDRSPHKSEQAWLEGFKSNLKNNGIIFPERTLLAFHTSMKVQDYSPMAVLAGISGTGKSLLPELYAHGIGMNFLQVAVQPRWDSPQDMLGFYNYMEGSFKATELSRLLWSADLYNNRDYAHWSMNLVLLDEMNLARVEYYFSDMLSKLEVRRGIDPEKKEERRAAEIELECCAGIPHKRLYIGANTLFVGTMNEDESTQSLSDKVLDRANVIRFGKPTELNVKPNKQGFISACSHDKMMTLDTWKLWQGGSNNGVADALVKPLQDINNKLMDIRRPFGHRVWQSIQAYVENYPGGTDVRSDAFRHALADQIEMKILPKLNGVDKQDPTTSTVLADIKETISEGTSDEELVKTLEGVINDQSNAFFQWKGVSR